MSTLIDSSLKQQTYTGVEIELRIANVYARGLARLIDDLIRLLVVLFVMTVLWLFGAFGTVFVLLLTFVIWWFYNFIFEVLWNGVTPGKYLLGLRAVNADGSPIGVVNSLLRTLLLPVDFLPIGYLSGLIVMVATKSNQRIGDIVAGTTVVYSRLRKVQKSEATRHRRAVPKSLSSDDRLMVLSYQDRLPKFSNERAIELAETLEPVLGKTGEEAVAELVGVAQSIRTSA